MNAELLARLRKEVNTYGEGSDKHSVLVSREDLLQLVIEASPLKSREALTAKERNYDRLSTAIVHVRAVRDELYSVGHRVDEGVCEAVLFLLRKLHESRTL